MPRVIAHVTLLCDNSHHHRRGPNTTIESVGHRAALDDVFQGNSLRFTQKCRSTAPISFEQPIRPVEFVILEPLRHF